MPSPELIAPGASGSTGLLSGSFWFHLRSGERIRISTDGGTTFNELTTNFPSVVISNQNVFWQNPTDKPLVLNYMPI